MLNNILKKCLFMFNIVFTILMIFILKIAIFNGAAYGYSLKTSVIFIGVVSALILSLSFNYIIRRLSKVQLIGIALVSFFLIIILEIFFFKYFIVHLSWDLGIVYNAAKSLIDFPGEITSYFFNMYPNNIGIFLIIQNIIKFCRHLSINQDIHILIMTNIIMINSSLVVLYLFISKVFGYKISAIMSVVCVFITPLYAYTTIFYTDTLSMIFPILIFLLYYLYSKSESKFRFLYIVSIGIFATLGTIVKTNIIIAVVALFIYIIFSNVNFKKGIISLASIVIIFVAITGVYKSYAQTLMPIPYEEAGFPATHWVMMGLRGNGGYNGEDVSYTASFKTKAERNEADIAEIKKRMKDYGVEGYLHFLNNKLKYTWSDGTMYAANKLCREPLHDSIYQKYIIGDKNQIYIYVSQISYVLVLLFILIGAFSVLRGKNSILQLANICIFGVFLFLIIWETRSRYLVCFLPVFIFSASGGLSYISEKMKKRNA